MENFISLCDNPHPNVGLDLIYQLFRSNVNSTFIFFRTTLLLLDSFVIFITFAKYTMDILCVECTFYLDSWQLDSFLFSCVTYDANLTKLASLFFSFLFVFRSLCAGGQSSRSWRRRFGHHESAHCSSDGADQTRLGSRPHNCVLLMGRLSPGKHRVLWMGKGQQALKHLFCVMSARGSEAVVSEMAEAKKEKWLTAQ